ncbi:hypothetical protein BsWGS_23439 [Bradybaena similaris]
MRCCHGYGSGKIKIHERILGQCQIEYFWYNKVAGLLMSTIQAYAPTAESREDNFLPSYSTCQVLSVIMSVTALHPVSNQSSPTNIFPHAMKPNHPAPSLPVLSRLPSPIRPAETTHSRPPPPLPPNKTTKERRSSSPEAGNQLPSRTRLPNTSSQHFPSVHGSPITPLQNHLHAASKRR